MRLDLNEGKGDDNTANTSDDYAVLITKHAGGNAESVPYTGEGTEDGYYYLDWDVPNNATTKARIRIESIDNPYDYSNPLKAMATYARPARTISGSNRASAL